MTTYEFIINTSVKLEARADVDLDDKGLNKSTRFRVFRVTDHSEIEIGQTYMSPMPGCCGIVVSHNTSLNSGSRHTGMSDAFRSLKEKMAKELGYGVMIATTQMSNIPAVGNFFKSKYKFVDTFTNPRTHNLIGIGIKKI